MSRYSWIIASGLLWAGSVWAGEDFCAAHGRMAGKLAAARIAGVSEADALSTVMQARVSPPIRDLLVSTVNLAYASDRPPATVAAQAEVLCRTVTPARGH
ncbi:MAG: hypothetical protein IPL99_00750 [Candidatus Competibacteraceae bacterium]|nr:hypothetical protein [Candidatus Competibacteraceae bacterium]